MKIALTSTPFFKIPPDTYGGLERVVYDLWQGLLDGGHKVVCFGPDGSELPENGFLFQTGEGLSTIHTDWIGAERERWQKADKYLDEFDIVHSHDWFGFPYSSRMRNSDIRVCHTHHGGLNQEWWGRTPKPPFQFNLIAISKWMKQVYKSQGFESQVCYNGVDMGAYPYIKDKGDRLLFLGRIDPIKAPHVAVEVAKRTGHGIDVVGGTSFVSDTQYVDQVKGLCVQPAHFVGEVNHSYKLSYLQNAKALILASHFGEPFGLVCIEALACGSPVIALRDGALEELITEDVGFVCDSVDEMADAVSKIDTISPEACRERAKHFSKERCAKRMEHLYKMILEDAEW